MLILWGVEEDLGVLKKQNALVVTNRLQKYHSVLYAKFLSPRFQFIMNVNVLSQPRVVPAGYHQHRVDCPAHLLVLAVYVLSKCLQCQGYVLLALISVQARQDDSLPVDLASPEQSLNASSEPGGLHEALDVNRGVDDLRAIASPELLDQGEAVEEDSLREERVHDDALGEPSGQLLYEVQEEAVEALEEAATVR